VCLGHCKQWPKSINTELPPLDCEVGPEKQLAPSINLCKNLQLQSDPKFRTGRLGRRVRRSGWYLSWIARSACPQGGCRPAGRLNPTDWMDPTSLVVLFRDPDQVTDTNTPQRFMCLDGMHRVHAVLQLLAEKRSEWSSDWVDAGDGDVRMRCYVIRGAPARESVVNYSLLRISQTSAVVKTSHIDRITSIGAAFQAAAIELTGIPKSDKLFQIKVFEIMKRSSALSNITLRGDLSMQFDFASRWHTCHFGSHRPPARAWMVYSQEPSGTYGGRKVRNSCCMCSVP
jgi:hypothetical protein